MGDLWLHWIPDYLAAEGLRFRLEPGWEKRARSSGGFDAVLGVQDHHTVSKTTPANDIRYCWYNASTRPIGNIILDRTGLIHVGAAGATNTSGKGGPRWGSRGVIPLDSGNRNLIAIEACNDGVGEVWPEVQTDVYVQLNVALLKGATAETPGRALTAADTHAHHEWAPLRKVDTRGPSPWAKGSLELWNMDAFRGDVHLKLNPPPPPPPITPVPRGDDVKLCVHEGDLNDPNMLWVYDGNQRTHVAWPGNGLAHVAQLWELEDLGVVFNSPRGTPGQQGRVIPKPFEISDHLRLTFLNALDTSAENATG